MFEAGKRYRIKTLEELLAFPDVEVAGDFLDFSGEPSVTLGMREFCGLTFIAPTTGRYVNLHDWNWASYMVVAESKKQKLLKSIKDFR